MVKIIILAFLLLHVLWFRMNAPRYKAVKPASGLQRMIVKPEVRTHSMVNMHVHKRWSQVVIIIVFVVEHICGYCAVSAQVNYTCTN